MQDLCSTGTQRWNNFYITKMEIPDHYCSSSSSLQRSPPQIYGCVRIVFFLFFFLNKRLQFLEQFGFTTRLRGGYKDFPYAFCCCIFIAFPSPTSFTKIILFLLTEDESILIHHNHPLKVCAYLSVHSWCCIFYGLGQMKMIYIHHYNTMPSILLP